MCLLKGNTEVMLSQSKRMSFQTCNGKQSVFVNKLSAGNETPGEMFVTSLCH